ncbi:MAG: hypothetical protein ABIQ57_08985, partial [Candidatus Kapaibacterium sp.]
SVQFFLYSRPTTRITPDGIPKINMQATTGARRWGWRKISTHGNQIKVRGNAPVAALPFSFSFSNSVDAY